MRGVKSGFGRRLACIATGIVAFLCACGKEDSSPPPQPAALTLTRVSFADLPGWQNDRLIEALPALLRSCPKLSAVPAEQPLDGETGSLAGDWREPCATAAAIPTTDDRAARAFLEARFVPFRAGDAGERSGLFTGYYEPELRAARERSDRFAVPLYRAPRTS